ncbi:MAG: peptidase [Planctomycetes bacterium]|nr:peptidase [Planctomycetota bacterium]
MNGSTARRAVVAAVARRHTRRPVTFLAAVLLAAAAVALALHAGATGSFAGYEPRDGDVLFQSLPRSPLVDAIEGVTESPLSHCGIVARGGEEWLVIEAFGTVRATPLSTWIARGRGGWFAAHRWRDEAAARVAAFVAAARERLGEPYDFAFELENGSLYCSELVRGAARTAFGRDVGRIERLGELRWQPFAEFLREQAGGSLPLERQLVTPRSLAEAAELPRVHPREE